MKKLFLLMVLPCLLLCNFSFAQLKPLAVGDKFPDIEFDNLIQYPQEKIRISDFRGKLVILDFWSRGCGSCIEEIPEMGRLQKHFGDKIRILPIWSNSGKAAAKIFKQWKREADSIWNHNPKLFKASQLPTILDTLLNPQVKHLPLAGVKVWIDGDGIVRGITTPEYVNEKEISKMLNGSFPKWRTWKQIYQEYDAPIVHIDSTNSIFSKISYTAFDKYKDYYTEHYRYLKDSIKQIKRISIVNSPILSLYYRCYSTFIDDGGASRFIVETKNKSRFYKDDYWEEWNSRNTYCFEKVAPLNTPDDVFYKSMISDLDSYFNIRSTIEKRKVKCFVLKVVNPVLFNKEVQEKSPDLSSLRSYIAQLNNEFSSHIPVIIDPKLPKRLLEKKLDNLKIAYSDFKNLDKVNAALKLKGLQLIESVETIPMVVLKDLNTK